MANLISYHNPPSRPQPHVPGYWFWATRNVSIGRAFQGAFGNQPVFPQAQTFAQFWQITAIANTAHAANHKTVTCTPFGPIANTYTRVFELTDDGTHTAPNTAVAITNGDTAAQVATALQTAIQSWINGFFPIAFTSLANGAIVTLETFDVGMRMFVTTGLAPGGVTPPLVAVKQGGVMYGEGLLARAWAAFVYTGYRAEVPFDAAGRPNAPQIPVALYPLGMKGPRAFPGQFNPAVNATGE